RCVAQELHPAGYVSRGIFNANNVRDFGEAKYCGIGEISHTTSRDVVEDQREIDRFRYFAELLVQAFLCGSVVVRHDRQAGLSADLGSMFGELDSLTG